MVPPVKKPALEATINLNLLANDGLFHPVQQGRILSRPWEFTAEDEVSKSEPIHKIKYRLLHQVKYHDPFKIQRCRSASHKSLHKHHVSVSIGSSPTKSILYFRKWPPIAIQENQAVTKKFDDVFMFISIKIYSGLSNASPIAILAIAIGTTKSIITLHPWISTLVQVLHTEHAQIEIRQMWVDSN